MTERIRPIFVRLPYRKPGQIGLDTSLYYHHLKGWKPLFVDWLVENYGEEEKTGLRTSRWTLLNYIPSGDAGTCVVFRDLKDATLFKLSWGGTVGLWDSNIKS